jgi:hypothetical protein
MGVQSHSTSAFIDYKKTYDSVMREVVYNILIKFGVPKEILRPIICRIC